MSELTVGKIEQLTVEQFSPRGQMVPQTVENLQAIMERDAVALEEAHKENGKLRQTINDLRQKIAACRWVPVSERLPEDDQPVLLFRREWIDKFSPSGSVEGFLSIAKDKWYGAFWNTAVDDWQSQTCMPTHWMPLPPPPESVK